VADVFPSYLFCKLRITKIYISNHSNATLHVNHHTQNIWIIKNWQNYTALPNLSSAHSYWTFFSTWYD